MASKVLVKLSTVPFSQAKKSTPELKALPPKNEGATQVRPVQQTPSGDRTAQLEQNMKYIQEEHQATLIALHREVEVLRQKNRELQFQLVFTKNPNCVQSSPSSPEENSNGFVKAKGSPLSVNVTPLQVELLEKDLDELKVSFNEVKMQNQILLELVEKQKESQQLEKKKEKLEVTDVGVQVVETTDTTLEDLTARLEDAESLVKRLRRANEDQQREIATMKAASTNSGGNRNGSGRSRGHENGHHNRGAQGNSGQRPHFHKFPPLQTQSYWHAGAGGNHSFGHNSDYHRNGRRRQDKQQDREPVVDGTVLPQLRNSNSKTDTSSYPPFYQSREYHEDAGDYYRERQRKYRGQRPQRDSTDTQGQSRDYKYNKDQHQRDPTQPNSSQASRKQ